MSTPNYDVAILGMGPVGCTAAILLAHAGLKVAAIERDHEVYRLPRAVNLDGEIVRAFQPLGLADAVNDMLQTVRPGERAGFANSKREFLFGNDARPRGLNGWQPMNMFDQPEVEGYLRRTALAQPAVTPFIGFESSGYAQDDDGVTLTIADVDKPTNTQDVRADYLIGCDGAASNTRRQLGSAWRDLGYDHEWLVVDVIVRDGHTLDNSTVQVCDPDRICTYVCTKDPTRRWEFKLNPGETREEMLDPKRIATLLDPWTPRDTYELRRAAVYQFHAATAEEWRDRRVLLAGDAAHQTPPFLGQGMNTGMRDVINLAWKLPMVTAGLAEPHLLDSYQAERSAHAHDLVDWAVAIGHLMEHLADVERAERAGAPPPAAPGALKSAGYGQGREAPPLRAGVIVAEQVSDEGLTGYLLRQPTVDTPDGRTVRFDELLGPGFALVSAKPSIESLGLSRRSRDLMTTLDIPFVSLEGVHASEGRFDDVIAEVDAVIVRPDRYVFGHTDANRDVDALLDELQQSLYLTG